MKLISLNIEIKKHYERIFPFLRKEMPDVVCLQELVEEDKSIFEQELGMHAVCAGYHYILSPGHLASRGKKQSLAIFAKNIISSGFSFYEGKKENVELPFEEYAEKDDRQENKVLLWADIKDESGKMFRFATTHFVVTKEGESTPYQLKILDVLFEKLDEIGEFVLCGDMNAPRGNETFRRLAQRYKDNIPLEYKTSLDQKLHRVPGLQFMVDGLFTTHAYQASNVKLVDGVSDHMAIVADIFKN